GEGLGGAVVTDGEIRRGHRGTAGEIAHIVVPGPDRRAVTFTEVFAQLGLRQPGSTAIDVEAVDQALHRNDGAARRVRDSLADALSAVLRSAVGFVDPELLIIGGPWGTHPHLIDSLRLQVASWPRPVELTRAAIPYQPELIGARSYAVQLLRDLIISHSHDTHQATESSHP
ncbi:MAG TPA: ROK family protein, partial [Pseudonocardiaceae bacterium]